jgi:hypothetical protein
MRLWRSLALVLATVAVAGCGGSGVTGSTGLRTSGDALAKSQLIKKADAICQRLNAELIAVRPIGTISEIAQIIPHRAVLEQRVVTELSSLTPQAPTSHGLRQIIAYRQTLAQELAELGVDAKRRDMAAIKRLAVSKARLHQKLLDAATSAGFSSCARTGRAS